MNKIVDIQLERVADHLKKSKEITLTVDKSLRDHLAEVGFDPAFGARPLKRLIQTELLDPLALEIIEGTIQDGQTIQASYSNNKVEIK